MDPLSLKYIGTNRLPTKLAAFELERLFSLTPEEIHDIRSRFRRSHHVAAAVQLVFLRVAGRTFDAHEIVPRVLLAHLGRQLELDAPRIATLRTFYRRRDTLNQHQQWAMESLGLAYPTEHQWRMLYTRLKEHAHAALSVEALIEFGERWLYRTKLIIPSHRSIRHDAVRAFTECEDKVIEMLEAILGKADIDTWMDKLFALRGESASTHLEWLRTPPGKRTPSTLSDAFKRIALLKDLGIHEFTFDVIPIEKQRLYATRLANRRPAKVRQQAARMRLLELTCFLHVALLDWTDTVLQLSGMRTLDIVRRAKTVAQTKQLATAAQYREQLLALKALLADTSQRPRARIDAANALLESFDETPASQAATLRSVLAEDRGRVRVLLKHLATLQPKGDAHDPHLKHLALLNDHYAAHDYQLPDKVDAHPSPAWKAMVERPDRGQAFRALEAATLLGLHKSVRRGSIWIDHSLSYRRRDKLLISAAQWPNERARHLTQLQLPAEPDKFLAPILDALKVGLAAVEEAVTRGEISIDDQGAIHLSRLTALPVQIEPRHTREALFDEIGSVQLPQIMLEMDAKLHYSSVLLGRPATQERDLLALYGALLAHGTELDTKGVAKMTPGIEPTHIAAAMRKLEMESGLRAANHLVVEFLRKHPIAKHWGDGFTASSDMMSLEASQYLWNARVDPRRRTYAIGLYTTLLDQHGIIYDQPVVLKERQAGPAIEGAIRQTQTKLASLAVDTHGFTHIAMAVAKLLGFDLLPRLADLKDRKLYVPRKFAVPESLGAAVTAEISLKKIRRGYDGFLRLIASIYSGQISVPLALERFGSAARGDAIFDAGDALGRLLRTLFLCDYFTNENFRRAILKILNRGESVHALQRAILTGKLAPERGRRKEEMAVISGSHALLTNLVMAWNTHHMQTTLDRWTKEKKIIPEEWLARISPAHTAHINFRGTFRFPFETYPDALLKAV